MTDSKADRFFWVDAWRGLAALGVVLFHARVDLWVGWREISAHPERFSVFDRAAAWLSAPLAFLGSGVVLFFVLSGFCIHWPQSAKTGAVDWRSYAWRRAWRIVPPYLMAALLSVGVVWLAFRWFGLVDTTTKAIGWKTFLMAQNYGVERGQIGSNPALWSLPVEIELYAAYPLFLWLWRRFGVGAGLGFVAAVTLTAMLAWRSGQLWLDRNFTSYWIVWCAGAWLAERARQNTLPVWRTWHGWLTGVTLALCLGLQVRGAAEGTLRFLWAGCFVLLVWRSLLLVPLSGRAALVLGWLGRISYSLYLVHFPVFYLCGAAWVHATPVQLRA